MKTVPESTFASELAAELVALTGVTDLRAEGPAEQITGAMGRRLFSGQATMLQNRNDGFYELASGVGLDNHMSDVLPDGDERATGARASGGGQVFERINGVTTAPVTIPAGTPVSRSLDGAKYVTVAAALIAAGEESSDDTGGSGPVSVVATSRGARYNVETGDIDTIATRLSGVTSTRNTAPIANGTDRENDDEARDRLRSYVRTIAAGTPAAILRAAKDFEDATYGRVKFACYSPDAQPGLAYLYLDDGAGGYGEVANVDAGEVLLSAASGGETRLYLARRPLATIPTIYVDSGAGPVAVAFHCVKTTGMVDVAALTAGDVVTAGAYTVYTGMVPLVQAMLDGNLQDPALQPGTSAAGVIVEVKPATVFGTAYLLVTADVTIDDATVRADLYPVLEAMVAAKINTLPIEDGTGAGIGRRAVVIATLMAHPNVRNVTNVRFNSNAADVYPGIGQVLRAVTASVTLA